MLMLMLMLLLLLRLLLRLLMRLLRRRLGLGCVHAVEPWVHEGPLLLLQERRLSGVRTGVHRGRAGAPGAIYPTSRFSVACCAAQRQHNG